MKGLELIRLTDVADISVGIILSRKQDRLRENNIYIYNSITLKSIQNNGFIIKENLEKVYLKEEIDKSSLTKVGDVVIRLSEPYTAVYIDDTLTGIVVPSNFAIVRLNKNIIDSEFLKYYLNSAYGKKAILKVSGGTNLNTINISNLKQLDIKKYELETQMKFIEINKLFIEEEMLLQELINWKKEYLKGINTVILD